MPVTFALCGQKGGSSKTTLAVAVAAELVARGRKVLLVDADPQGSARTWAAVANEVGNPAPSTVAMGPDMHKPGQLDAVAEGFDVVVLDTPPRHGDTMRSALMVADVAVLPCGPSAMDAWALAESLDLVSSAQTLRPELRAAVVLTRKVARTAIGKSAREALEASGLPVFEAETGYRVAYQEAPAHGLGIAQYTDPTAAAEVRALVDELESFNKTGETGHGRQDSTAAVA